MSEKIEEKEVVETSRQSEYLPINPRILRADYRYGRTSFKASITTDAQNQLCRMGIIQLRSGKTPGTRVAVKGGFGSAFLEFMVTVFGYLLSREPSDAQATIVSALLRDIFDSQESVQIVKRNLMRLVEKL